ncbi:MAG: TonB-dependent receptor [Crocinitomicaceae bacterium]|nr:TonB-dependent receptor [Crocinitomicaceae bacterium]MBP6032998.1 TonB-dependent receptor [Crocinitomicaceae bacterium]
MKKYLFAFFCILQGHIFAQLSGVVIDKESKVVISQVSVKSSENEKVETNSYGTFIIPVKKLPVTLYFQKKGFEVDSIRIQQLGYVNMSLAVLSQDVKTVVVTSGKRNQNIEEIPISIEILKPALIANKGFTNLEQAVNQSPGVFTMDGQVSIRGGGGYAYGAGSRVMLLWNGIPMLSPDVGDVKWNAVPMEQASQIEILKGASSVLYGSGALNGIIALTEKEAKPEGQLTMKYQSGVYGDPKRSSMTWWNRNPTSHLLDVYYGKSKGRLGYTIGVNGLIDEGYREGNDEKRARINGSLYYFPKKYPKMKLGMSYQFQWQDKGVFILWKNDSMGYQALENTLSRQRAIRLNVDPYLKFIDKHDNKHYLRTRYYLVTTGNSDKVYDASFAEMYYADYNIQKKIGNTNLISGFMNMTNKVTSYVFDNHLSNNLALYEQVEMKLKKLDLTAGLRLEFCQLDKSKPETQFVISDKFTSPVYPIFRLGTHYAINKASHLRASFGQGIRFPSVAERYISASVGSVRIFRNPDLRPETGWNSEIGWKQILKFGKWMGMIDVAGFVNQYSNMTEFSFGVYKPDTMAFLQTSNPNAINYLYNWVGFQAQNAEKARITGLEFSFNSSGKIGNVEVVSLLGYTYMNPISLNNDPIYRASFSDTSTNMLKYRFNHLAKADVQASYKKWSIGGSMRYNSFMKNIDRAFEVGVLGTELLVGMQHYRQQYNKGVFVFDARLSYELKKGIKLNFIANNFLNAEYASRPGDLQAPRNFTLQLQYDL